MHIAAIHVNSPLFKRVDLWPIPSEIKEDKFSLCEPLTGPLMKDVLSQLAISISQVIQFPLNTTYLHGLGCICSAMTKGFFFDYRGGLKPVNIYIATGQPPSTGKSGVNDEFVNPIKKKYKEINEDTEAERMRLERKVDMYRKTNVRLNRRCQAQESYVIRAELRRVWRDFGDMMVGFFRNEEKARRAAVAEAYEDAARIAGEYPYGTDPRHIAAAIRARAKED